MTAAPESQPSAGIEPGLRPADVAVAPPPAAYATRRICPYLAAPDGVWRSSMPTRDHHCGAVEPPSLLTDEKQRRLCLSDRHTGCSTFQVAAGRPGPTTAMTDSKFDAPWPRDRRSSTRSSPDNRPGGETVTRWSIVRTRPVVLDHPRVPSAVASVRNRNTVRFVAAAVVAVAILVLGVARLWPPSPAAVAGVDPSPSPVASTAAVAPTTSVEIDPTTSPSEAASQRPATESPAPATPAPTTAATAAPPATTTYKVKDGDTLYGIAGKFDTSVRHLQDLNKMGSSTLIHPGDEIRVR